jgi:Rha family phage regulatory protein
MNAALRLKRNETGFGVGYSIPSSGVPVQKSPKEREEARLRALNNTKIETEEKIAIGCAQKQIIGEEAEIASPQDDLGVKTENGKIIVSSLDVAKAFGKEHRRVLQDIRDIDCSKDFNEHNFVPVKYRDAKGEERPAYNMTRDGFTFLAMSFTGARAAQFKEAYIMRFNEMEDALRGEPQGKKALTIPDVSAQTPGKLYSPKEAAEELLLQGYRTFYDSLVKLGILVKVSHWHIPKPEYVRQGLFVVKKTRSYKLTLVTPAGLEFLRKKLGQALTA